MTQIKRQILISSTQVRGYNTHVLLDQYHYSLCFALAMGLCEFRDAAMKTMLLHDNATIKRVLTGW